MSTKAQSAVPIRRRTPPRIDDVAGVASERRSWPVNPAIRSRYGGYRARVGPGTTSYERKARSTPASSPRPNSARPVLTRSLETASIGAAVIRPTTALPVSEQRQPRQPGQQRTHARVRKQVWPRSSRGTCYSPPAGRPAIERAHLLAHDTGAADAPHRARVCNCVTNDGGRGAPAAQGSLGEGLREPGRPWATCSLGTTSGSRSVPTEDPARFRYEPKRSFTRVRERSVPAAAELARLA